MRALTFRHPSPLPGFGLAFGFALTMLSIVVLVPIGALLWRGALIGPEAIWETINRPRVWAALQLSFLTSLYAALFNLVFGLALAWVLVRYRFWGRKLIDAAVDLPFALPTAVAGIALTALYAPNGAFGQLLAPLGIKVAYTPLGIWVALVFVGLPFVVRTVQPVIEEIEREVEEAVGDARCRARCARSARVILPMLTPALLTGFALALARVGGGIRLGDLHRGQPAERDRDRAAADRDPARGVRLRRGGRHRARDAGDLVPDAACNQSHPGLEQKEISAMLDYAQRSGNGLAVAVYPEGSSTITGLGLRALMGRLAGRASAPPSLRRRSFPRPRRSAPSIRCGRARMRPSARSTTVRTARSMRRSM